MNTNQQFSVSCHVLTILAAYPDQSVTSDMLAGSVDTNPVVIRRIMAHLRQHGLVDSRSGANGGWRLVRQPAELSLRDVYHAVSHETALAMHQHPNPDCPIGGSIRQTLGDMFDDAQKALELALDKFTVADVLEKTTHKKSPAQVGVMGYR